MNDGVLVKQGKGGRESVDIKTEKRNNGKSRMAVWVFKEERREGQKMKRWIERVQDRGNRQKRMNRGKDGVVNNGWSVLRP